MIRFLSHRLRIDGVDYPPMSLLTVDADGTCRVDEFGAECHSTSFVNGLLTVETSPGRLPRLVNEGREIKIDTDGLNQ